MFHLKQNWGKLIGLIENSVYFLQGIEQAAICDSTVSL